MTERTQRIKELIYQSSKKAADPNLTGTDVQKLQGETQKMIKKTFKEFVEAVVSQRDAEDTERKWNPDPNKIVLGPGETYGSKRVQDALEAQKAAQKAQKEAQQKEISDKLYKERTQGRGIYGYYKDPETGKVRKGWKKNGVITWVD